MELDSASEPSELNYEQGEPEPIYDSHQREKSTGSGLVLAVPAMVLEPEPRDPGAGVVVSAPGGEYENLVADNQYYEQAGGQCYSCKILTHVTEGDLVGGPGFVMRHATRVVNRGVGCRI